ncbi:MAG: biotin synthase BioB [Dehalococcoidia bacterium]|nr:biotin synthase BioB [Dehalococcoidia bacterium]MDZ4246070.1 biotin synthase BioB [Dehalococcoidia bacterium]
MNYKTLAEKALRGEIPSREECRKVLAVPREQLLDLLAAAYMVRKAHFDNRVLLHMILNAKSGLCTEDCSYCSQSAVSSAAIDSYPVLDEESMVEGAVKAKEARAIRYCIVASGQAPGSKELDRFCRAVTRIKSAVDISICTSLGFLDASAARALKEAGVDRYNHNLNTSRRYYGDICTTHSYQERLETLRNARDAGLELCCGALFGMGETEDDITDLCFSLRELNPASIPVNFFHPVPGTPLEEVRYLTPLKCLAILCLVRFINPATEIRVAGGREHHLRMLQPLSLYPANSLFVSGYLTTPGQSPQEAWQMVSDMGFEVVQEVSGETAVRY